MHALPRFCLALTTALTIVAPHGFTEEPAAKAAKKSDEIVAIYDLRDLGDRAQVLVERLRHLDGVSEVDSVSVEDAGGQAPPSYSITVRATHEAHAALARKLAELRKQQAAHGEEAVQERAHAEAERRIVLEKALRRSAGLGEIQQRMARLQAAMSEAEIAGRRREFEEHRDELARLKEKVVGGMPGHRVESGSPTERRVAELEQALDILERHGNREAAQAVRRQLEEARQAMRRHRERGEGRHDGDGPHHVAALHEEVRALRKDVQELKAALRAWMARAEK